MDLPDRGSLPTPAIYYFVPHIYLQVIQNIAIQITNRKRMQSSVMGCPVELLGDSNSESSVDAIIRYLGVTIEEVGRKKLVL